MTAPGPLLTAARHIGRVAGAAAWGWLLGVDWRGAWIGAVVGLFMIISEHP